ncbi:MAG TPA: ABC transporter substrate-binding protein [Pusillimonas sp.]|uniref:ABC transporter substrate-binding protein n=2 Tax=unclassified Pusillimonas TaxID=2640016 RepID=UPI002B4B684E|nr:ABC transporter substrate-binding protein [Pusillimonas sp.]HLU19015.1 ABC transporter substrate-binding protein [Pusillimonas sp.]
MKAFSFSRVAAALALAGSCLAAQAQEPIKIGFVGELSGPQAPLGQDQYDALMLYVEQQGGKMGGIPVEVIREDSQLKPDIAVQAAQKLIENNKVSFLTGMTFAPTAAAVAKVATDNKVFAIGSNGSVNDMAGKGCSPYVFIMSFQPEPVVAVLGEYADQKGYKRVSMLGPNYVTGKNFLDIFKRSFKGTIADELYTPMAQQDFSAELLQVASSKPDAVFVFYPGGLGINFVRQYQQSGLGKDVPLLAQGALDGTNLPALQDSALGFITAASWAPDSDNPQNKAFVKAFEEKYGRIPTMFAAYSYDAAQLIDSAITKVKGNLDDKDAVRAALKAADFPSVRGSFRFNNNHFPIQDYHILQIAKDDKGRAYRSILTTPFKDREDPFAKQCPMV